MSAQHRSFKDRLLLFLAPRLGSILIRMLGATMRIRFPNGDLSTRYKGEMKPVIYASWHESILTGVYTGRGRGVTTLISQHRDGELIARTAIRLGFKVARGSSTRGGAGGLKGLCDAAEKGSDLSINPDGPRGPAKQVQPGVIMLASLTGLPIFPAGMAFSSAWRARSWDRFVIPKPFSRAVFYLGNPIEVPRELSEEKLVEYRERLRQELLRAEELAEAELHSNKKK